MSSGGEMLGIGKLTALVNWQAAFVFVVALLLLATSYWGFPEGGFLHDLTHEIGFALIVALVIWGAFEFSKQSETDDRWNERIEKIAKNVFFGVFKRNFPEKFIREANILVLDQNFIRSDAHITYTISDGSFVDRDGTESSFVKLSAIARYKVRNVGNVPAIMPIEIGLPNPLIDEMKSSCKVSGILIKQNGHEIRPNLAEAEEKFREKLKDDSLSQIRYSIDGIDMQPDEEIEVVFDYTMAKENEDTEIFQTKYPTDGLIITIMDRGPTNRAVRARSIHPVPLENDTSAEANGTYNFKLSRYLLPHQGFAIWWKRIPAVSPLDGT